MVATATLKAILMTLTPLSLDLTVAVDDVSQRGTLAATPYGAFIGLILRAWQAIPVDHPALTSSWTVDFFHPSIGLYTLVFLVKLPLLILDILTGLLLYHLVQSEGLDKRRAIFAFWLWFLNPYVVLVNELWGAVDLLPTFLVLLTLSYLKPDRKKLRAAVAFGAATAFKLFPILLLPVFSLIGKRSKFNYLLVASGVLGVAVYLGWVTYAGLNPWLTLREYGQFTQYFDEYAVSSPNGYTLGLCTVGLVVAYSLLAEKWAGGMSGLVSGTVLVFLVFFSLANWSPQFLIWLIPFLVLDVVLGGRRLLYMTLLLATALFMSILAFNGYFTSNGNAFFFVPANNSVLSQLTEAYARLAQADVVIRLVGPLLRALFVSTCIVYWVALVEKNTKLVSRLTHFIATRLES